MSECYVSIQLVCTDYELASGYDTVAVNRFVKRFELGKDSPKESWYAVYIYKHGIADWAADCATLGIARVIAKAIGKKLNIDVSEDFPAGVKINRVERQLQYP